MLIWWNSYHATPQMGKCNQILTTIFLYWHGLILRLDWQLNPTHRVNNNKPIAGPCGKYIETPVCQLPPPPPSLPLS